MMLNLKFISIDFCNMCGNASAENKKLGLRLNKSKKNYAKEPLYTTVIKCSKCGYLYANPQPIEVNFNEKFKELEVEEYWKIKKAEPTPYHFNIELETLKKILSTDFKNKIVLDIGFGLGNTLHSLHQQKMIVWGIESYQSFYDNAKKNELLSFDRNNIQCVTFEDATFENEKFDLIIFEAFQHIVDSNKALQKAFSWLKPNGLIQIEVVNANWFIAKLINLQFKLKSKNRITNLSPLHAPYNQHEFTLESFKTNAAINNYTIEQVDYYVCDTYLPGIIGKLAAWYMKKTNTGMQFSIWLRKK